MRGGPSAALGAFSVSSHPSGSGARSGSDPSYGRGSPRRIPMRAYRNRPLCGGWLLEMSPDDSLNDFLGARDVRRRSRPGPPEWSGDRARSGRGLDSFLPARVSASGPAGVRGASSAGPVRLVLEVLLWLVGRYSEQGVMLHVCKMVLRRRLFRMTWLKVGARRALRAVGGAWRDSATMC